MTSFAIDSRSRPVRDQTSNGLGQLDTDVPHNDQNHSRGKGSPGLSLQIKPQSSADREGSSPVANKMAINRGRFERGATEPLLLSGSPPGSRVIKATSHSPGSPGSRQSPLYARSFLTAMIGEHQRRTKEALASSSPTDPKSPSSGLPQQMSPNPTSPAAPSKGQARENPSSSPSEAERPQSPLFVRKFVTDTVDKEMRKKPNTSPVEKDPLKATVVNGDMSNGVRCVCARACVYVCACVCVQD